MDERSALSKMFAARDRDAMRKYCPMDNIVVDQEGNVVAADDPTGQHVFMRAGTECPMDLALKLDLPGAVAQNAEFEKNAPKPVAYPEVDDAPKPLGEPSEKSGPQLIGPPVASNPKPKPKLGTKRDKR